MTTPTPAPIVRTPEDLLLRRSGIVLLVALLIHGVDHVVRGLDVVTAVVTSAGTVQFVVAIVSVRLVFTRHPSAPALAMLVGFAGAIGFASSHLLPQWSALSDPYVGVDAAPGVTWFSWLSALIEIGADLAFGWAGLRANGGIWAAPFKEQLSAE